jgi:hypothetical protein
VSESESSSGFKIARLDSQLGTNVAPTSVDMSESASSSGFKIARLDTQLGTNVAIARDIAD